MKKTIISILVAGLIGLILSNYAINEYKNDNKVNAKNKDIYLFQFGAYKSKEIMEKTCQNLENYFYYKDNNLYHVLIGISSDKKLLEKIKKTSNISSNIYVKKINTDNTEFLESLNQYDNLVKTSEDSQVIINAEKQILSKYNELILDEQNIN